MKYPILAVGLLLCVINTTIAGTGFEPVISGVVDDIVNEAVDKDTINTISDRLSKFGDIYGSAKKIPGNVKEAAGGTKTTEAVVKKEGLTFWQKIDRLILRTRNSNH